MKKVTIIALFLMSLSNSFANNNPKNPEQILRQEIAVLLESPDFKVEKAELTARIEFTVNNKGEFVVLTVASEESVVEDYIKSRLNYKKTNANLRTTSKVFKIKLRIKKDS
ncbi:hypothetical protein [Aquimarina brevivitae]|uniref:TonB-like protein n=1 Tax=Aquimarina brevivitae TaxID=323412 RepID=A0A4V2F7G7_9FLAO|nr:hypothetical protein [Aquimarina brevivitae]RZS99759.1 hypothetical protein EV197_0985 [Aquimarina brevivitae]